MLKYSHAHAHNNPLNNMQCGDFVCVGVFISKKKKKKKKKKHYKQPEQLIDWNNFNIISDASVTMIESRQFDD